MTVVPGKLTIPDVLERFAAYYRREPVWGSLHVVLDDGNVEDRSVRFCLEYAEREGDVEGAELARLLLRLSRSQRLRLAERVQRLVRPHREFRGVAAVVTAIDEQRGIVEVDTAERPAGPAELDLFSSPDGVEFRVRTYGYESGWGVWVGPRNVGPDAVDDD